MRTRLAASVFFVVTAAAGSAAAQVESWTPEERGGPPAAAPAPAPAPAAPAPAAAPAPVAAPAVVAPAPAPATAVAPAPAAAEEMMTITIPRPKHKWELAAKGGAIGGGEMFPKGLNEGHAQPSWILLADADYLVHPFFTLGGFAHLSNMGFEQYSAGKKTSDGSLMLSSLGASMKGRMPVSPELTLTAGILFGRNFISASTTDSSSGKTSNASGGGWNIALAFELSYLVASQVALVGHLGFVSQVAGSVDTDDGKSHDLAFSPIVFATVGPEVRF